MKQLRNGGNSIVTPFPDILDPPLCHFFTCLILKKIYLNIYHVFERYYVFEDFLCFSLTVFHIKIIKFIAVRWFSNIMLVFNLRRFNFDR